MRTSNPALNDDVFRESAAEYGQSRTMTLEGTVMKTGVLLCLLVAAAGYTWAQTHAFEAALTAEATDQAARLPIPSHAYTFTLIGSLGGFLVSLITIMKPRVSALTRPRSTPVWRALLWEASRQSSSEQVPRRSPRSGGVDVRHAGCALAGLCQRHDQGVREFQAGSGGGDRGGICLVYLASFDQLDFFTSRFRCCTSRVWSELVFRHLSSWLRRSIWCSISTSSRTACNKVRRRSTHGVVRRFRTAGHAGVVISRNAAPVVETAQQRLIELSGIRSSWRLQFCLLEAAYWIFLEKNPDA